MKTKFLTILLSLAFACAETQSVAQISNPPVADDPDQDTLMQCLAVMLVIGIGVSITIVYIKAKNKGVCVLTNHRRDLEKALEGDFGDGATNNLYDAESRIEWAAEFVMGPAGPIEESDLPRVSFRYVVPPLGMTNVPVTASILNPADLIDDDAFRVLHGLSPGMTNSFAVNGKPVKTTEPRITKIEDVIYVNVEGKTNAVTSWQRSTNLSEWKNIFTISAPVGNTNWTTESGAMQAFFRVVVH